MKEFMKEFNKSVSLLKEDLKSADKNKDFLNRLEFIKNLIDKKLKEELNEEEQDLKEILKLEIVKEASLEGFNGFGTGILKDGRPFCFGRANGTLEMDIYENQEELENGFQPIKSIKVRE